MKARCGHFEHGSYARAHNGLCRRSHSKLAFLLELEEKRGDDALVEYWYSQIVVNLSESKDSTCIIDHLVDFYEHKLVEVPSTQRYIRKMLYMLRSLK
ncbi:MAG TPA: hypothetical protein VNI77_09610 [Nitrososphaera sp.]|nr:hypothetical protein [Nitrososphaera sp.]